LRWLCLPQKGEQIIGGLERAEADQRRHRPGKKEGIHLGPGGMAAAPPTVSVLLIPSLPPPVGQSLAPVAMTDHAGHPVLDMAQLHLGRGGSDNGGRASRSGGVMPGLWPAGTCALTTGRADNRMRIAPIPPSNPRRLRVLRLSRLVAFRSTNAPGSGRPRPHPGRRPLPGPTGWC